MFFFTLYLYVHVDSCTNSATGLTKDYLTRWLNSMSKQTSTTYITTNSGTQIFVGKSVNQAVQSFTNTTSKLSEVWMSNSPCSGQSVNYLTMRFGNKPITIHISHLYATEPDNLEESEMCLAKLIKSKFKVDAIDWNKLSSKFINTNCKLEIKRAQSNQKFLDADAEVKKQIQVAKEMKIDPNVCPVKI